MYQYSYVTVKVQSRRGSEIGEAMEQPVFPAWAKRFLAVTVFVDDLAVARRWYIDAFEIPIADESANSCAFWFPGGVYINLNSMAGAEELIEPAPVGGPGTP